MQITDVKIRKILNEGKMKAIVSVTFDNAFVVHDIKVVEGKSGLFVAMPSRRVPNGDFRDVAHPITTEARKLLEDAVLQAFNQAIEE
ncbi:MAG: septation regulator SpoVG [Bacillota bacterium]